MSDLVITPHPLTLAGRTIVRQATFEPGETLADLLRRHDVDLGEDWTVSVGGATVPLAMLSRTRPRPGMLIECRRQAGRDVVRTVAMVVLAYYTFGPGAEAIGLGGNGFGTFALKAGIYMAGAAIINRTLRPPAAKLRTYESSTGSTYSLAGGRNRKRPYEPLGLLFGVTKVIPDLAAEPYTWFESDEQQMSVRLSAGVNTASVDDLKIGQTAISAFAGVLVSKTGFPSGNTPVLDWPNVDTVAGAVLTAGSAPGSWVERTSSVNTRRVALDFVASLYSMNDDGSFTLQILTLDIEYRLHGSGSWTSYPSLVMKSAGTKPLRITETLVFGAAGQYDVRVRKATVDVSTTRASNAVEWTALKSFQQESGDFGGYPQVNIRIQASGQVSGTLDEVSWVATSRPVPVWDGSAWSTVSTRNPGAHVLQAFRGIYDDDGRLQAGMGLDDAEIDIEGLKAFMVHCTAHGYVFDHWFDAQLSNLEMIDAIAAAGLGSYSRHTGKHGVVWLAAGQPIEAMVTMGNIAQGSFRVEYTARAVADELEVAYFDRDDGYTAKALRLLAPGVTAPRETARLSPAGVTTEAGAATMGRLAMAQNVWGRKAVAWEMDLEHVAFRRYSLISLSHDMTRWGFSGRLKAAANVAGVITLTLDDEVPANAVRYIGLRLPGEAQVRVFGVNAFSGSTKVVTLSSAWPVGGGAPPLPGSSPDNPAHDTLWIYDFKPEPGLRLRVTSVEPTGDMKGARIVASPEPDDFWTYMASGAYVISGTVAPTAAPSVSNLVVTQRRPPAMNADSTELTLTFDAHGAFASAQVWGAVHGEPLQLLGATTIPRFGPIVVSTAGDFDFEIRPFDRLGRPGPVFSHTYTVALVPTAGVTFAAAEAFFSDLYTNNPTASIRFRANGTVEKKEGSGGSWTYVCDWYTGGGSTVGYGYWLKVTRASGGSAGFTGTLGSWLQLNGDRVFTGLIDRLGDRTWILDCQFATTNTGAGLEGSGTATITVEGTM